MGVAQWLMAARLRQRPSQKPRFILPNIVVLLVLVEHTWAQKFAQKLPQKL